MKNIYYIPVKKENMEPLRVAAYCRVSTKKRDAVSQFDSSNYGIYRTNIRSSRLDLSRGVLGLWKKWIKAKGP